MALGGVVFSRQLGHKLGALVNGNGALKGRDTRACSLSLPALSHVSTQQKHSHQQSKQQVLARKKSPSTLILYSPAFKTVRNTALLQAIHSMVVLCRGFVFVFNSRFPEGVAMSGSSLILPVCTLVETFN